MLRIGEPVRWAGNARLVRAASPKGRRNWRHWALEENNSRLMTNGK
ncbi:hypothetical protein [Nostoc sp.]